MKLFDPSQELLYFFEDLSRQQANELLKLGEVGSFLVRTSTSDPSNLSLSLRVSYDEDNYARHYFIEKGHNDAGKPIVTLNGQTFYDLPDLITHFTEHPLGQTVLVKPVTRNVICQVTGKFRFAGERITDLPFDVGETIDVISKPEENWWVAKNKLGDVGLIPVPYDNYNNKKLVHSFDSNLPIFECHDDCTCSKECLNRLVGNDTTKKLEPFYDENKGYGLKTVDIIQEKVFVIEYKGEIVTEDEAKTRSEKYKRDGREHNFIFTVKEHFSGEVRYTYIDATMFGGMARFINHSCEPNLTPVIVRCGSVTPRLALFANKAISKDTELCYDYGLLEEDNNVKKKCHCGAEKCRGFLPSGSYGS
ncbi:unnamed protein product [Bursaphelenchus okinawaensis]|uniref:Histone-lysine N-methyltransferase n=1 Tax=Bursaphelenchus okinawaensis TaxID=465554 RepID=A0A811KUP5_9BILA|nr:unnamed protein product [Bursaphelenchus okinawaensis]CAG9112239.1 unnamed protein product [Bursaphelenchus okinawaensis]